MIHDAPPPRSRRRRRFFAALAVALILYLVALSTPERREDTFRGIREVARNVASIFEEPPPGPQPVRGQVFIDDQPAKGAVVTFWPLPLEQVTWRTVKPQAMVEADGSYQPNSYDLRDGAKPGEYLVTVLWTGEGGGPGPDRFKGRYADPKRPVTRVTIAVGENVLEPIRLALPKDEKASDPSSDKGD